MPLASSDQPSLGGGAGTACPLYAAASVSQQAGGSPGLWTVARLRPGTRLLVAGVEAQALLK